MKIKELVEDLEIVKIINEELIENIQIEDINNDSRKITKNSLFIAENGYTVDGHEYISEAIEKGAIAVIYQDEKYEENILKNVVGIQVKNSRKSKAYVARAFYQNPQNELKIIGVTGTKGKTTTTFMIREMLQKAGLKTGLIGTIYTAVGDKVLLQNNHTTPDSIELYKYLRVMANEGVKYVIMEVSSQALKLNRVDGIEFEYGIFTNIYKEHLNKNEHSTIEEYLEEKLKLIKNSKVAIINEDDIAKEYVKAVAKNKVTYSAAVFADYNALDINIGSRGVSFSAKIDGKSYRMFSKIPGKHTVYNALAAIAVARQIGVKTETIKKALEEVLIPGRFELVENYKQIPIVIDFATLPESIEILLKAARLYASGRVVIVYGAEGEKNKEQRKLLGRVTAKYADLSIITTFNPRHENVKEISEEIMVGIKELSGKAVIIEDRKKAIRFALEKAQPRDIIILAGMGHNKFMLVEDNVVPFIEKDIVKEYYNELMQKEYDENRGGKLK